MPKNNAVATHTRSRNANTVQSNVDLVHARNALRAERDEQVARPSRNEHTGETAGKREQQALDHELPHEARARRAQRGSRGDLLHPAARERQQQVRNVGARRNEHQRHGTEEQPERSARRAEHGVRIRRDARTLNPLHAGGQGSAMHLRGRDLCSGCVGGCTWLQPRDQPAQAATQRPVFRDPHVDARFGHRAAQHRRRPVGKLKGLRHHADDRERLIVKRHAPAHHIRIARETRPPQWLADDGDELIVRSKRTPGNRLGAQHLEE